MRPISKRKMGLTKNFPESLVNPEYDYVECSYVHVPAHSARFVGSGMLGVWNRVRAAGRSPLAGSVVAGPAVSRCRLSARAATVLLAATLLGSCSSADAASKPSTKKTSKATKRKTKPKTVATTTRPPSTTRTATTTTSAPPKLSAQATAVLAGYEAYLAAFVAGSRDPERARDLYAKGMTGDALARLIEIADFDVAHGQYWDGTRAAITSNPRVQTIGETTASLRDCQSVGGVVRKRATNEPVAGGSGVDVDDLLVDLVKLDGRWVVTRTDRANQVEGKATCAGSSP